MTTISDDHVGTRVATSQEGLRVDRVDRRTVAATIIESPYRLAESYVVGDIVYGLARKDGARAAWSTPLDGYEATLIDVLRKLPTQSVA